MTMTYRFTDRAAFMAAGGTEHNELTRPDGIGVSVIGDHFDVIDEVEVHAGFLVNTTQPVDGWEDFQVSPSQLMRIFG